MPSSYPSHSLLNILSIIGTQYYIGYWLYLFQMYNIVIQPFKDDEPIIEQSTPNIVWVLKLDQ